jgi:hypothetical protein
MNNDSLAQVINVKSSTGRALTPQIKRHSTPQRNGSAPRSTSAPKNLILAQATHESQSCNRKLRQTASRRTRQRWENDNLFGLRIFLSKLQTNDDEMEEGEWREGAIATNWQSLFGVLMLTENSDALSAYLACSSSFIQDPHRPAPEKTFQDCATEWERAEVAWRKVERRLRQVVALAIVNQSEARNFILMLEDILLEMDAYLDRLEEEQEKEGRAASVPFVYSIPHEMEHHFARPVRVSASPKHAPVLQITLRDSAYHRLLLHATCQFHSRNSKVSPPALSLSLPSLDLPPPSSEQHREGAPHRPLFPSDECDLICLSEEDWPPHRLPRALHPLTAQRQPR